MKFVNGLVSIIIPVYNGKEFIKDAIESCLNQTYKNCEIIVIDDGSTDNLLEYLNVYILSKKIQYYYKEKNERSSARNMGIKVAKGEYIQFLDADDILLPSKLENQVKYLKHNEDVFAVYCLTKYFKVHKTNIIYERKKVCNGNIYKELLKGNFIPINAVLMRKNNLFFDENLTTLEDWDFWLRSFKNKKIFCINKFLCLVRVHNMNTSRNRNNMLVGELNVLRKYQLNNEYLEIINYKVFIILYLLNHEIDRESLNLSIKCNKINLIKIIIFLFKQYIKKIFNINRRGLYS